jgi:periplasmic divalent cation tolerance protein
MVVVYVTVPSRDVGRAVAKAIVEEKLAACVNIVPGLESIYIWEGKVNADAEELLLIKTRQSLLPALTERVKALHPYTECEVIAAPIVGGSDTYLQWVADSTKDDVR